MPNWRPISTSCTPISASSNAELGNGRTSMKFKQLLLAAVMVGVSFGGAYADDISVKIGVLNDRSGVYADLSGQGSVIAAQMAVEDFKAADKAIKVDIVSADT